MNKKALLVMGLTFGSGYTYAQQLKNTEQHFVINGKFTGIKEPAKVFVIYRNHGIRSDSSEIKNGEFSVSGVAEYPQKASLLLAGTGGAKSGMAEADQVSVYLESGTIEVSGSDSLKSARIGGSRLNKDQQELVDAESVAHEQQVAIIQQYRQEPDSVKRRLLAADYSQKTIELQAALAAFIVAHPNSLVALHSLRANFNPSDDVETAKKLFESLSDSIRNAPSGQAYKESIENVYKLSIGKMAPDFGAKNMEGAEKRLSDFRGKYVLLDFWASWCGPCRKETPNLVAGYQKYKGKGFEILSLSIDQNVEEWKKAVKTDNYVWTNLKDGGNPVESVAKLYGVTGIPTNYLIDPSGKIVAMNLRGKELDEKLAAILK